MKIETFELERTQSLWENTVEYNLTETGIHPFSLQELFDEEVRGELLSLRLGYGYTNGSPALRQAISGLYDGATVDEVLVTNGSAEANLIATWSLLEPGDELVLMLPNYMQIWGLARALGVNVKPFHLREERNWAPDLNELSEQVTSKTKMIAVCNPNNPTGAVLQPQEMAEVVEVAKSVNAWLYADEVYRGAEIEGGETPTFWGRYDKAIVCCGLSKAYALPGLRIGWLVGPMEIIQQFWACHDYTSISSPLLSNQVAVRVLQPALRSEVLGRNRNILRENLNVLTKWVQQHASLFGFVPPRAGGLAFLRYYMDINSTELATNLREHKSVFVVAGDCFGLDRFVRIGLGTEKKYLMNGLSRFGDFIQEQFGAAK